MDTSKYILIVDDNLVNRQILSKIFMAEYLILEAVNGREAMSVLSSYANKIVAVMLDLVMPEMDGFAFLQEVYSDKAFENIPILVITGNDDKENEIKALRLGAWDFVSKPYNAEIIKFRLKNAVERSQLSAFMQLKYLAEYDALTGIYNRSKFFAITQDMVMNNKQTTFAFLRFDIDRFQLINSFFGIKEGNKLLKFIGTHLSEMGQIYRLFTYGRIEADVFCFCMPYEHERLIAILDKMRTRLTGYNKNYDIVPSFGIYIIDKPTMTMDAIYDCATLAVKPCKGNYLQFYNFYDEAMSQALIREQEITNEMNGALAGGQFQIYWQPKYSLQTELPCGAEALVRWIHPKKGLLAPSEFIPIFERNGFIVKMDFYVWERVCIQIRKWLDSGIKPLPVSVNISRVNMYNPRLCDTIINLVEQYGIAPELLNLELTESAYTDNPVAMKEMMARLQSYGFEIMMDDFGSGYSSLNILKDISVDVLKLDIRFLSTSDVPGRGENILASVVRMAKWLNIPTIVEGVETERQTNFLRSIGCDYAQGYYFARPMPLDDYERHVEKALGGKTGETSDSRYAAMNFNELWTSDAKIDLLLNSIINAVGIYELCGDKIELIRANDCFFDMMGNHDDFSVNDGNMLNLVVRDDCDMLLAAFEKAMNEHTIAECQYRRYTADKRIIWINIRIKYILSAGTRHLFYSTFNDITRQKQVENELAYNKNLLDNTLCSNISVLEWNFAANRARFLLHSEHCSGEPMVYEDFPQTLFDRQFFAAESVEAAREAFAKVRAGEKVVQVRLKIWNNEHTEARWQDVCYTTVCDQDGIPMKAVAVSRNLTDVEYSEQCFAERRKNPENC